jgi:3-phenylpropionate/cinnamic acid dioxygenase small subunit
VETKDQVEGLVELKEKMDIIELQHRYVRSVDEKDWKTSVEVFHPDGKLYIIDAGKKRLFGNKNEIETFYRGIAEKDFIFSRHFITNYTVEVNGNKASFKSYYNATYVHDNYTWIIFGLYDDKMVKEKGQWKILEKEIDHGWNDFLIPLKDLKLKKEAVKEAKKKIFILAGEIVPER